VESAQYVWTLAWWPYALLHGVNPFVTDYLFYPDGYNIVWTSVAIPGPSVLLAPVTLAFGPVVAYNVLALAGPILSAFTGFVLCRKVTGAFWPALVGGYLFGFSSYALSGLLGNPHLSLVPMVPLLAYLVLRRLEGSLSERRFVAWLIAALVFQYLSSSEIFALATLFGALAGVAAYALSPERRPALRGVVRPVALAYLLTAVVISPILYYTFFKPHLKPPFDPVAYSSDLLSFAVPTPLQWLGGHSFPGPHQAFGGLSGAKGGGYAYLGLPVLAIVVLFAIERWRTATGKLMLLCFAGLAIAALGPKLHVDGKTVFGFMPWRPFGELPLLRYALPARFSLFTALVAGLIVSMWLARRPSAARWALVALALAFVVPPLGSRIWKAPATAPPFFEHERYAAYLHRDDHVLTYPYYGPIQRWQAQSGMAFRLANGYLGRIPVDYDRIHSVFHYWQPGSRAYFERFVKTKRVTVVLIAHRLPVWSRRLRFLGVRPREVGGVLLYRLAEPGGHLGRAHRALPEDGVRAIRLEPG
jgi:hypothetical protein